MTRKTREEARVERITWFLLVMIFIGLSFDESISIPEYVVPALVAAILLISSMYQYSHNWKVSPVNWITAAILIVITAYDVYFGVPFVDLVLVSLLAVVGIILFGVVTNES